MHHHSSSAQTNICKARLPICMPSNLRAWACPAWSHAPLFITSHLRGVASARLGYSHADVSSVLQGGIADAGLIATCSIAWLHELATLQSSQGCTLHIICAKSGLQVSRPCQCGTCPRRRRLPGSSPLHGMSASVMLPQQIIGSS